MTGQSPNENPHVTLKVSEPAWMITGGGPQNPRVGLEILVSVRRAKGAVAQGTCMVKGVECVGFLCEDGTRWAQEKGLAFWDDKGSRPKEPVTRASRDPSGRFLPGTRDE